MAIQDVQLIYRLQDTIRLLIDYRPGPIKPDWFNFYWSSNSGGPFVLFADKIRNEGSLTPAIKGKILFDFLGSSIPGWNNHQTNYIMMAQVIGGVVGVQEGPLAILPREEMIIFAEKSLMFGYDKITDKFVEVLVNSDGKLITTV